MIQSVWGGMSAGELFPLVEPSCNATNVRDERRTAQGLWGGGRNGIGEM